MKTQNSPISQESQLEYILEVMARTRLSNRGQKLDLGIRTEIQIEMEHIRAVFELQADPGSLTYYQDFRAWLSDNLTALLNNQEVINEPKIIEKVESPYVWVKADEIDGCAYVTEDDVKDLQDDDYFLCTTDRQFYDNLNRPKCRLLRRFKKTFSAILPKIIEEYSIAS